MTFQICAGRRTKLYDARKKAGMSLTQLADRVGIASTRLSHYERASHEPLVSTALKLAAALNSTVEELFAGAHPED